MHLTQGFRSDPQSQFWAAAPLRLDEYSSRNNTLALFPFPESCCKTEKQPLLLTD